MKNNPLGKWNSLINGAINDSIREEEDEVDADACKEVPFGLSDKRHSGFNFIQL